MEKTIQDGKSFWAGEGVCSFVPRGHWVGLEIHQGVVGGGVLLSRGHGAGCCGLLQLPGHLRSRPWARSISAAEGEGV